MKLARALALLFALALVAAACGADGDTAAVASEIEGTLQSAAEVDAGTTVAPERVAEVEAEPTTTTAAPEPVVEEAPVEEFVPRTASAAGEAIFGEDFPDIIGVEAVEQAPGTWNFSVTVSSPYDTPQRYADAWRVVDPNGNELGIRILAHDHANEQPFTRSQPSIEIPEGVTEVTVQGRDLANGWGGTELVVQIP